ncbi:MAG: beta-galactosidase [Bacteroidales bacterium]|nr:beta-galactosidase [Bacteroidales bacterium]
MNFRLHFHRLCTAFILTLLCSLCASAQQFGQHVAWDDLSLLCDGQRVCPVMGEIHYSRLPQSEWDTEVRKMRMGGVTLVATYVFWNHVEEQEGRFDWSGQRNLRAFLEVCRRENMPVVLRLGPFCHGEVRCGGIPDWLFSKGCRMRSEDPVFLHYTERLYTEIFRQVKGLQWKDGGPVLACQFDNEYRGRGSYLMALKQMAQRIGFDLPFYTRTGWPELATPVPYGEMLPLYGDYADGFWDRSTQERAGDYWRAFHFRPSRTTTTIASEQISYTDRGSATKSESYPYFTCELGGGMMTSYHRRVYLYPDDAYSMALVKLGSGSNLLGYYMYHGGTNPEGLTWLNETQRTQATNYNDLPVKTYDFQAPLGEFGQVRPHFYSLRLLHLFMHDYGDVLAPMKPVFSCDTNPKKDDDSHLRWAYRTDGKSTFVFINNYARLEQLSAKRDVQLSVPGFNLPHLTIPSGVMAIFPVNVDGIDFATAQIVAKRDGRIYMMPIDGIPTTICYQGKTLRRVKPLGMKRPVVGNIYLLRRSEAERLFLPDDFEDLEQTHDEQSLAVKKVKNATVQARVITLGVQKVAEEPTDSDFLSAAVYDIPLPAQQDGLLRIRYHGDVARLYAGNTLLDDNFYNGRPFDFALWRLPDSVRTLQLRILPMQTAMPVYFPREADTTAGERVESVTVLRPSRRHRVIDLSGSWDFSTAAPTYTDRILLPASMPERDKGDIPSIDTRWICSIYDSSYFFNPAMESYRRADNFKLPFCLTPRRHYVGEAWYRRHIAVDKKADQRWILSLERPHIQTTLLVNGQQVGSQRSLCVPHEYDVTDYLQTGDNVLELCIDNRPETVGVGIDSHSITDQTQGDWNGVVGRMELRSRPLTDVAEVQVFPDIDTHSARLQIILQGKKGASLPLHIFAEAYNSGREQHISLPPTTHTLQADTDTLTLRLDMGNAMQLWDENHPVLYRLHVNDRTTTFGMRRMEIRGRMFYVNGQKVQLRGTVENCCFPLTGYPPTDLDSWLHVMRRCKEFGLNHIRFHSYCPPEAAFEAADLVGMYLQPEGPSWPNHGVKLGYGADIDTFLMDETQAMNRAYGNHPSFCMLASGNEPAGRWVEWVGHFVDYWKQADPRHVYTGASVGGGWAWQPRSQYHVKAGARGLAEWANTAPESTVDFREKIRHYSGRDLTCDINEPYVSHETGQWCAFPNFDEIRKYTGVNRAGNFEIFRDLLNKNGMGSMAKKFLLASGYLQTLCYKHEIERTLRTPDYAGFQLLGINDYSGQGTALVGVTDVFYDDKGYCSADDFREFCSDIVPLARLPKFTYQTDETLHATLDVSQFSGKTLSDAILHCSLTGGGQDITRNIPVGALPVGLSEGIATHDIPLSHVQAPAKLTLSVSIPGTEARNHWDVWVYPNSISQPKNTPLITTTFDERTLKTLQQGGDVLLLAAGKVSYGAGIVQHFTPVFWNTSWFKMRPPHTTGLYIDAQHPVFRDFPTDAHSDLQWWELVNKAQVMLLSDFPADFQPTVQSIDTWFLSRKIGMLFECRVGKGRLIVTSIDLSSDLDRRIVARQLRHSILRYMQSADFQPTYTLTPTLIQRLFTQPTPPVNMFTNESPDELKPVIK